MINAQNVKKLREMTGVGMIECKKALEESSGDFEGAVKILQKRGSKVADKKSSRDAREGYIGSYVHSNGKIGVLVEVNCETDFVARSDEFKEFARDIAMHIAAMKPAFVSVDDIDESKKDELRKSVMEEMKDEKKPADIMEKIVDGKVKKRLDEMCLLTQAFVKNPDITVSALLTEKIAKFGENLKIRQFTRFEIG